MLWSNMYSAASPRFTIHSPRAGGRTPNAMFCAYVAQVAWLSPQIPQIRLVMKWASRGSFPFMKMLYPRKIDEVLWHCATRRFSKSILVKIPRLPTIRVIGSQFMSTRLRDFVAVSLVTPVIVLIFLGSFRLLVRPRVIARGEFGARVPPLRFLVDRCVGHGAQCANRASVHADGVR